MSFQILNKIEFAVNAASDLANASDHISADFNLILNKLHEFIVEQEALLNSLEPKGKAEEELENDIELFYTSKRLTWRNKRPNSNVRCISYYSIRR